ncbi:MAG: RcpC/CpaB family pilus assembly protein [Gemmataceae bacterium]
MTAALVLLTATLAAPPDLGIAKDPYATDQTYRIRALATSVTGRTIIPGTRVDVMVVEGFRTGQYTRKFVIEDVRVNSVQRSTALLGEPTNMVTINVSERQLAELELAAEKGKLILTLHPLVLPQRTEVMSNTASKGLLQKRYTDKR